MNTTNKHKLPRVFEKFMSENEYSRGDSDISITSLIDSPQVFRLRKKHDSDITQDVSDQIFSILGTAVHAVLEQGCDEDAVAEERIYLDLDNEDGSRLKISGAIDLQTPCRECKDGWIISDYKTCSANTLIYAQEGKPEWHRQLNCYAQLVEEGKGEKVCGIEIIAICRDWTAARSKQSGYPDSPVVRLPIPLWSKERREDYIKSRVEAHRDQGVCSAQDRWSKPGKYAVEREGRVRAVRILDTRKEAEEYISDLRGDGYSVSYRPSTHIRCENNYCQVADFCDQWKDIQESR